jgi:hypothetical protein
LYAASDETVDTHHNPNDRDGLVRHGYGDRGAIGFPDARPRRHGTAAVAHCLPFADIEPNIHAGGIACDNAAGGDPGGATRGDCGQRLFCVVCNRSIAGCPA